MNPIISRGNVDYRRLLGDEDRFFLTIYIFLLCQPKAQHPTQRWLATAAVELMLAVLRVMLRAHIRHASSLRRFTERLISRKLVVVVNGLFLSTAG